MGLDRRDFLRVALLGSAAGVLNGCTHQSAQPKPRATTLANHPHPSAPDWAGLRTRIGGRVLRPGDRAYDAGRLLANPRFDALRPQGVVQPSDARDVAAAVSFARNHGLPLAVRAGGHSYGGWSSGPGVVVDTSSLRRVTVDRASRLATIGAGARLVDVYAALSAAGQGIAAGSCPSVGMAGLTLGGGIGVLSRAWGLTCDALTSVEVVTADGRVLHCDARHNSDLFWACRGGGGGSFGVVTSFTMRTRPAPAMSLFFLRWPLAAVGDVLDAWQHWAPTADPRLWSTAKALVRPGDATSRMIVAGTWLGSASALAGELSPLLRGAGAAPVARTQRRLSYGRAMLAEAGCDDDGPACHLAPGGTLAREAFAASSHMVSTPLPRDVLAQLLAAVDRGRQVTGMREGGVSFDALGGAVTSVAKDATAFVHRDALFAIQYTATYAAGSPGAYDRHVADMRSQLPASAVSGAYVNYADPQLSDWQQAYWGSNYARLQAVKRTYDPDDLFSFAQGVKA